MDDPHHPEDEGESSRKKEKERAVGDAVESLRHPEFHDYYFDSRSRTVGPPFATTGPGTCQLAHGLHTIEKVSRSESRVAIRTRNPRSGTRNLRLSQKEAPSWCFHAIKFHTRRSSTGRPFVCQNLLGSWCGSSST